ncbi:MAG TPA: class I SAM-dependent methyltransferase [Planctomycetota bacterium]|nr:class I SAM-dependent methyltransferase [Planctomycetota bacterium]
MDSGIGNRKSEIEAGLLPRREARRRLLRLYAGHGRTTLFCWLRYWHANVPGIETYVPSEGTILDLGCGHGVLTNYLALRSPRRRVVGFDLSQQRIAIARSISLPNAEFRCQDVFQLEPFPCRAIIVADVLHHLRSYQEGDDLLARCCKSLPDNGLLVVKEIGQRPWWKYQLTRPVDTLFYSGKVFFRSPAQFAALFGRLGLDATFVPLHSWRPLCHIMYVCRKRPAKPPAPTP